MNARLLNSRLRKFWSYYLPYRRLFFADVACALILSITTLLIPLCVRYVTKYLQEGVTPDGLGRVYWMGAVMLALVAIYTACDIFVAYQGHVMGAMMERDMRRELFEHLQKLSFGFYDEQKTGQLMTRIANDSFHLSELFHHGPEDIVISTLNFIGAFVVLSWINPTLAFITFLFLPVMAIYATYFNLRMRKAMRRSKDRVGDINAQIEDSLAGVRVARSFANEQVEQRKFETENNRFLQSRREEYKSEALFYEGLNVFTNLMPIAIVVFGGVAIVYGTLDLADMLTFLLYIGILIEPIKRFGNFMRLYQEGMTGFERFMEIMEVEPEIVDVPNALPLDRVRGDVEFRNVSFRYKAEQSDVLRNVSLTINAGEYVALVGASGVGKTTFCSLIPRFYEVSEGSILLDGECISEVQLQSLRQNIGIVQQDVYLFAGTVAENIRYGKLDATNQEIVDAAKKANAHNFIMSLPNGYDTDIGQRGVKLSGGQKQRLSIARVFLKDPPILIFDEATSSLDNESEKAVQESLEKLSNSRTTIVIAHRLSTVRNAQRIIVLAEGRIAEQGTHESLLMAGGVYANLYNLQARI